MRKVAERMLSGVFERTGMITMNCFAEILRANALVSLSLSVSYHLPRSLGTN